MTSDALTAVSAEAARWHERRARGPLDPHEEAAFQDWTSDPDNAAAFDAMGSALNEVRAAKASPALERMRAAALDRARAHAPRRARRLTALAASLALALAAGFAAFVVFNTAAPVNPRLVETAIGERLTVMLEDGSQVTLNTQSRLAVDYAPETRRVTLLAGQALFEVAKDPTRPFVVAAADRRITALGTEFDVRLDEERVAVTLIEGSVKVDHAAPAPAIETETGTEIAADAPAPETVVEEAVLVPGEQLVVSLGSELAAPAEEAPKEEAGPAPAPVITTADIERITSWRRGRMVFDDDALADAVAEVNRYAHRPIVIADPRLSTLRVSGAFPTDEVDAFVEALTQYFPIKTDTSDPRALRLVWRE